MYKCINDHTVKRRKIRRSKHIFGNINIKSKKLHSEGGEQIMKEFTKFKLGKRFEFKITGDYTKDQPEDCKRVGRIDIPMVVGYFYALIIVSFHWWFIHWEEEICFYWEL